MVLMVNPPDWYPVFTSSFTDLEPLVVSVMMVAVRPLTLPKADFAAAEQVVAQVAVGVEEERARQHRHGVGAELAHRQFDARHRLLLGHGEHVGGLGAEGLVLGDHLSALESIGIVCIVGGLALLAHGSTGHPFRIALLLACVICVYTIIDAKGARTTGSVAYVFGTFVGTGMSNTIFGLATGRRREMAAMLRANSRRSFVTGIASLVTYGMVLVAVLTTTMTVVQSLLLAHTITRLDMRLMSEFYRHVLSLPMPFFLSVNKGEILARFGENQKIRAILTGSSITTVMNVLMLTIYFLMMFAYSWKLTIIVIFFLPVFIAIVTYFTPRLKRISQEIFQAGTQAQSSLIEALNGIEAIKATSNEYFARARWENAFVENVNRSFHQQKLSLMNSSIFQLAILGMTTAVLWSGASQVIDGTMSVGELMGFNMLMGLVTSPVLQMVNLWSQLQEVRISVDRVGEYLDKEPEIEIATTAEKMRMAVDQLEGLIEFKNIYFSYRAGKDTKNIMENFNLVIQPGEKVAFVGPAGCGKSTIAKMILGFNVPQAGELQIDGKNVNQMDISSLRRNIGVVLQDSFLFAGTVAENIAFGDPEPDMQTVQEVARLAGAEEFITRLPLGYQTLIGEKGQALSGGQRQRVCIARALYRRPRIMIFDEATSALDNQTEEGIIRQLKEKVLPGRTSISIAHRLTTIMNSDRICYIRDGIVQEQGTHHQLIDPNYIREQGYQGYYYNLAKTQFDLPPLEL